VLGGVQPQAAEPEASVPIVEQWKVQQSGVREAKDEVLRRQSEWEKAWRAAHSRVFPVLEVPKTVNLDEQVVLAVYAGQKRSGGYSVEVTKVEKKDKVLEVTVLETTPGSGPKSSVRTTPACFAVLSKSDVADRDIKFVHKTKTR